LAAVVFLGYALTPGLGSLVAHADYFALGLHINKFTAPGLILIFLNLATIIAMVFVFDNSIGILDGPTDSPSSEYKANPLNDPTNLPEKVVKIGACVFIFLNFNARGILSVFETVNSVLYFEVTGKDPGSTKAVVEASNFQFYLGCLGLITYFSIERFRHRVTDVNWVLTGFTMLIIGNLFLVFDSANLSFFRLATAELFVWSIGCPITTAVVVAAFSKLLGGRPQGTLMGLLGSAASISRIVLPLLPAAIPSLTPVFWINILLSTSSVASLIWYRNLVENTKKDLRTDSELGEEELELSGDPRSPLYSESQDFEEK
jgi:ceroid-lipofuscinosis MFS transporter 7